MRSLMLLDRCHPLYAVFALDGEIEIVWRDNPLHYLWVRENLMTHASRSREPGRDVTPGRVIAYSILSDRARRVTEDRKFARRVWWVRMDDPYKPDFKRSSGCPAAEGVEVASIRRGVESLGCAQ